MIDADKGLTYGEALDRIQAEGIEALLYTTASNTDDTRFRIAVPLRDIVDVPMHKAAIKALCRMLRLDWKPDTTKVNCFSFFYLPAQYAGAQNRFNHLYGAVRSAAEWIDLYPVPVEQARQPEREQPARSEGTVRSSTSAESNPEACREASWSPDACGAIEKYRNTSYGAPQ